MSVIELPTSPAARDTLWTKQDFGGTVGGALGASTQRIERLGGRWALTITIPVMSLAEAGKWSMKLMRGHRKGVIWTIRQLGLKTGSPGTPIVDGASQAGDTIDLSVMNPGYVIRYDQAFSIVTGGRRYCYKAAEPVVVPDNGEVTVEIEPPLRKSPDDADVVEFGLPKIQGLLVDVPEKADSPVHLAPGFSFTIAEQR